MELWLGRHRIDARHMSLSPSSPPWWETDRVTVLILDTHRGSTWNGEGFRKSGHTGVSWQRKVTVENPPAVKSEALDELKRVYEVFDNRRFSFAARNRASSRSEWNTSSNTRHGRCVFA